MTLEDREVNNTFHEPNKIPSLLRVETSALARPSKGLQPGTHHVTKPVPTAGTSQSQPLAAQPNCNLHNSETVAKAALGALSSSPAHQACVLIDSYSTQ